MVFTGLLSTLRANLGVVNIYDSASQLGNLRSAVENAIAKLVHTSTEMLTLHFMECQQQENTRDCGLFAIANATELVFKGNPSTVRYASGDVMRFHLIECLEAKQIDPFPRTGLLE